MESVSSECISGQDVSASIRASLDYFAGIRVKPLKGSTTPCRLLLVASDHKAALPAPYAKASLFWEFRRGGGRQLEILRLYRRG
jgi:hypothetical protein